MQKPFTSLAAYELTLRGAAMMRRDDPADTATARNYFKQAIAKDPNYGLAHAHLAFSLVMLGGYGWPPLDVLSQAQDLATRAIMLARDQSAGHRVLSFTQMYLRDHAGAEHSLRRALERKTAPANFFADGAAEHQKNGNHWNDFHDRRNVAPSFLMRQHRRRCM